MLNQSTQAACAQRAARQHGVITRAQAIEAGMTRNMISTCLESGEWEPLFPSTYALPGVRSKWLTRVCGAVLGCGHPSAASHRTAARLLRLDGFEDNIVEITSPKNVRWSGVLSHRGSPKAPEVRKIQNIPTTTAAETLLNLGAVCGINRLEGALDSALVRGLVGVDYLMRRVTKATRRPGIAPIKKLLEERTRRPPTESELERLYHRKVTQAHALPTPHFQFEVPRSKPRRRVDFAYPPLALGVEVLGWKTHGVRTVWRRDWERHNQLTNMGWEILYFTWVDIATHPDRVAAQVQTAVDRRTRLFV